MTRILFAVLSSVRRPPIGKAAVGMAAAGWLLLGSLLAGCAADDQPRPMHIAAEVVGQAVQVEVTDIPPAREITDLVLVDAAGRETPARAREVSVRAEVRGGHAGPGVGRDRKRVG